MQKNNGKTEPTLALALKVMGRFVARISLMSETTPPLAGDLELRIARNRSDEFDEVVRLSKEGCDCKDFEACLKLGIQYFDWIVASDERYRSALYDGKTAYDKEFENTLAMLMRGFHHNCQQILEMAAVFSKRNYELPALAQFEMRCREAAAIVDSLDETDGDRIMSEPLIILQDRAILEHQNEQTAEFI
jgi:hypothetical protein